MNAITEEKSSTEQGATNATSSICKSDPSLSKPYPFAEKAEPNRSSPPYKKVGRT
jgi:hypothetical protein